jgi:glycosyltransferase involved in cell wall biosynthesis
MEKNNNKLRLLFVNESLHLAGGERSLITMLSKIDSNKFHIDLQLIRYGGELDSQIPDYVNILPELDYPSFSRKSWAKSFFLATNLKKWKFLISKIKYSICLRKRKRNSSEIAQLYWETVGDCYSFFEKEYDVAIAYAQGLPTFYVHDKIKAKKKIAWINVNIRMPKNNVEYLFQYYKNFNFISLVSQGTFEYMSSYFSDLVNKMVIVRDMIDYKRIVEMSKEFLPNFLNKEFNILTVARLNKHQKGYDILLNSCKILKSKHISFHWYIIGEGPYKSEMLQFIKNNKLEDCFTLLGTTSNPYPFYVEADLYVQTSRHEGYGLSIAEARLLNTPVVTTNYDTVHMQMKHEKNGLITEMTPESVAESIIRMMEDKSLYQNILRFLENEEKEDLEPLQSLYGLLQ